MTQFRSLESFSLVPIQSISWNSWIFKYELIVEAKIYSLICLESTEILFICLIGCLLICCSFYMNPKVFGLEILCSISVIHIG